ncbi:sensor histidine kinase [Pseudonocardia kunmingensis]|uniref:Oxygen sensor histidine kinase NreB n=1 Tax=Pseudonocardia kunmingensis TaxID=630975 RepID=A0A543DYE4_9PSEU|nr:sensor histidine kinase [Pseudonocardia kunmingensis]TQM14350.1 signal transduction histidine kinase [Pseudonocardia kunmingensis]
MTAARSEPALPGDRERRLDAVEHRIDVLLDRWSPYAGLLLGAVLTPLFLADGPVWAWVTIGVLAPVTALWCALLVSVRPVRAERPAVGAVYIVGLLVLMTPLVYASPFFAFQVIAVYIHSFAYLRGRWRFVAVAAGAALVAYSQVGGRFAEFTPGLGVAVAVLVVANSLFGGGATYFGVFISEQSQRRRQIIEELNESNRRLSETLGENAALHAQLLAQAREAGVIDERARLAREIHDTIAQGLTGIVTQLEAAGAADGEPTVRRRHIDTARALARESLTEARRSVDALAPGQLAAAQLPDAIAEMAKAWAETAGVELILDTTGDPRPLLPELEVTLFRVAQEALANVGKHAQARRVGLTLSYMDDVVVLDVRDDGRGFVAPCETPRGDGSGFGLTAMEQRVRRVSGTLTVESEPGEGAALSASVPAIPAEVR